MTDWMTPTVPDLKRITELANEYRHQHGRWPARFLPPNPIRGRHSGAGSLAVSRIIGRLIPANRRLVAIPLPCPQLLAIAARHGDSAMNHSGYPPDFERLKLLRPDAAQEAQWRAEARANPPEPESWEEFYVALRWAKKLDELDRKPEIIPPECPPGLWPISYAMLAFNHFLLNQRRLPFLANGHPVSRLIAAIGHLASGGGYVPPFLKPIERRRGNPGNGDGAAMIQGVAAHTYSELMEAGLSPDEAGRRVASALRQASERGLGPVNATRVQNWHERISCGPGPGAPELAVQHYREQLDPCFGSTPLERGKALLAALEQRAASFVG
jgi:hypothetical protein